MIGQSIDCLLYMYSICLPYIVIDILMKKFTFERVMVHHIESLLCIQVCGIYRKQGPEGNYSGPSVTVSDRMSAAINGDSPFVKQNWRDDCFSGKFRYSSIFPRMTCSKTFPITDDTVIPR